MKMIRPSRRHAAAEPSLTSSTDTTPRYSIVIPAYNEQDYLGACLTSLAQQDYPGSYEIIVVDNNSTDDTAMIARSMGATVVVEPMRGVCQARQRGTEAARGAIIVSTDADTTFHPAWLSTIDLSFTRQPDHVAVAGPCHFIDAPRWGQLYEKLLFGAVNIVKKVTGRTVYVSASNIAFRKSAWTGYDTRLTQGGDELDLLRRLQAQGKVGFEPGNPTFTSSRRMDQGLLYNLAVSFFYYYLLGYTLNRIFHRPVLGMAPAFRMTNPDATGMAPAFRMKDPDATHAHPAPCNSPPPLSCSASPAGFSPPA